MNFGRPDKPSRCPRNGQKKMAMRKRLYPSGRRYRQPAKKPKVVKQPMVPRFRRPQITYKGSMARSGAPNSIMVDLISIWEHTVNEASQNDELLIYANSAFDPSGAMGAGQPANFDQYAAQYFYYKVSWAVLEVLEVENKVQNHLDVVVYNQADATAATTLAGTWTQPGAQRIYMYPQGSDGDAPEMRVVKNFMHSPKQVMGALHYASSGSIGQVTGSPTFLTYIKVFLISGANLQTVDLRFRLRQRVRFFTKKQVIDA